MRLIDVTFEVGKHRIWIRKVSGSKTFYQMFHHHGTECNYLSNQPTYKAAEKEARRILREKNHV